MPTILRFGPYRVVIYTQDHAPAHVHVIGAGAEFIFFLDCHQHRVSLRSRYGGTMRQSVKIAGVLNKHLDMLCEAWELQHGDREGT